MKFKKGDIVLATKKSMPEYIFNEFLQLSPLGVGVVVSTGIGKGRSTSTESPIAIVRIYPIKKESTLFFFREEDLVLLDRKPSIGNQHSDSKNNSL
jgi:hypothetical protein